MVEVEADRAPFATTTFGEDELFSVCAFFNLEMDDALALAVAEAEEEGVAAAP